MRPDGTGLHLLAGPVPGEHGSWSPDGARITFSGTAPVQPWDIFIADADGTNVRDLTRNDFYEMAPSWSPDGKHIAYGAAPGNVRHVGFLVTTDILVMDADGTHAVNLTHGDPATPGFPEWLPDGRLSFTTQAGELWLIDADGGNKHGIAVGAGPVAWRP
jgi:TolB protein